MIKAKAFIAALIMAVPVFCNAADAVPPLALKYKYAATYATFSCKTSAILDIAKMDMSHPGYSTCKDENLPKLKAAYKAAATEMAAQPSAAASLKEHYIQALITLDEAQPLEGTLKSAYQRRNDENMDKLDRLWRRFEVDLE